MQVDATNNPGRGSFLFALLLAAPAHVLTPSPPGVVRPRTDIHASMTYVHAQQPSATRPRRTAERRVTAPHDGPSQAELKLKKPPLRLKPTPLCSVWQQGSNHSAQVLALYHPSCSRINNALFGGEDGAECRFLRL